MDIPLSSDALDLSFHPRDNTNLLAVGLISGKIQLVNYDDYAASPSSSRPSSPKKPRTQEKRDKLYRKLFITRPSKKSCRALAFSTSGDHIFSVSKDKSLFQIDTETGKVVEQWVGAHEAEPSRVLPVSETMVVTGDDDGVVKLWDPRKRGVVREWNHHFDWITDMLYLPDLPAPKPKSIAEAKKSKSQLKKERKRARLANEESDEELPSPSTGGGRSRLIVTSGDGSLSSIDLLSSGPTSFEQSEDQEDELLSVTPLRSSSSTKLVVGTQLGILSLWTPSRGLLDHVDRVPGHPASVDTLVTLDDETVLTGSSDGLVRVVQILPSKLLGVIASHGGLPVERMRRKEGVLASIGHSNAVKLTDLTPLLDNDEEEEEGEGEGAIGITGLDAADTDDEEEEEEEEEVEGVDFAGLQNDSNSDVEGNEEDEDEGDSEEEGSPVPPPPSSKKAHTKTGKRTTAFFSDM